MHDLLYFSNRIIVNGQNIIQISIKKFVLIYLLEKISASQEFKAKS